MDHYFLQVAQVDNQVRKLEASSKTQDEVISQLSKHLLVNDSILQYNSTFDVLSKVLKGEDLARMCDYLQEKQEELTKKRSTITNLSRKESRHAV